jgi:hypothetical protein
VNIRLLYGGESSVTGVVQSTNSTTAVASSIANCENNHQIRVMADQDQPTQSALASTFPNPPLFWRDFNSENIARIGDLRKEIPAPDGAEPLTRRILAIPEELVNLQAPAEPEDGRWRVFGDQYTVFSRIPGRGWNLFG